MDNGTFTYETLLTELEEYICCAEESFISEELIQFFTLINKEEIDVRV